jgi:hypothetical protein
MRMKHSRGTSEICSGPPRCSEGRGKGATGHENDGGSKETSVKRCSRSRCNREECETKHVVAKGRNEGAGSITIHNPPRKEYEQRSLMFRCQSTLRLRGRAGGTHKEMNGCIEGRRGCDNDVINKYEALVGRRTFGGRGVVVFSAHVRKAIVGAMQEGAEWNWGGTSQRRTLLGAWMYRFKKKVLGLRVDLARKVWGNKPGIVSAMSGWASKSILHFY